jgi:hypothetical protein
MADFSFVKDPNGKIRGVWVNNPADAQDNAFIITLFLRGGLSTEDIAGTFRVVHNKVDNKGGCFVMLGSALAPGEEGRSGSSKAAPPEPAVPYSEDEILTILRREKILLHETFVQAIKRYREMKPGFGLAEAKEAVEALARTNGITIPSTPPLSFATKVFLALLILAIAYGLYRLFF